MRDGRFASRRPDLPIATYREHCGLNWSGHTVENQGLDRDDLFAPVDALCGIAPAYRPAFRRPAAVGDGDFDGFTGECAQRRCEGQTDRTASDDKDRAARSFGWLRACPPDRFA